VLIDCIVELKKRTDEFFAKLVSSQEETFDAIADMVDSLTSKLNESSNVSFLQRYFIDVQLN
jgi:predicted transcriptional regulator